jgi:uncharacterized protein
MENPAHFRVEIYNTGRYAMKWIAIAVFSATVAAPCAVFAQDPSFDCARAGNATERAICASPDLSIKDSVISALYSDLRRVLGSEANNRLIPEQRAWLASRNACGGDQSCIDVKSQTRILLLEAHSREVFGGHSASMN